MKYSGLAVGLVVLSVIACQNAGAQSLKDLLNSETAKKVLNTVKQATVLQFQDLIGVWQYEGAACRFKSDDMLQQAGGVVLAKGIGDKLEKAYSKAGIVSGKLTYTLCADSTFHSQFGKKTFRGTFAYDASTGILTLNYFSLLRLEATVVRRTDGISLLFDQDRLLKLVTLLSNVSKSASLSSVGKVAEQYDGLMLGFDLKK